MKFIYGEEKYFIDQKVKELLENNQSDIKIFDENDTFEDIVTDIKTISLFFTKKTLILKNINAFSNEKEALKLVALIKREIKDLELIFQLNILKINKKNSLVAFLLKKAMLFEFKVLTVKKMIEFIKKEVAKQKASISEEAILKIVSHLPLDANLVSLELYKLLNQSHQIDQDLVEKSVTKYVENDYFALTNAILKKDKKETIKAYQNQINQGDDPVFIISQLSNLFVLAFYVNLFLKQGKTAYEISNKTKIHIFRIKNVLKLINTYSLNQIDIFIAKLKKLDQKIKSGLIDKKVGLDQFVLSLIF